MAAPGQSGTPNTTVYDPITGAIIGRYDANGQFIAGNQSVATVNAQTVGSASLPGDMTANTGWMSGIAPGMASNIYDNPQDMLANVMSTQGNYNQAGPMFQQLSQLEGADPLTLYMLSTGANQSALGGQNANDYGNYLGSMYLNQMTPGGGTFNFANMMSNLLGMPSTGADGQANSSSLYNLVTAGNAGDQVQNVYNMVRDAARVGLNPLAAKAALTAVQRAGTDYRRGAMTGQNADTPFFQWLQQTQPALAASFTQR